MNEKLNVRLGKTSPILFRTSSMLPTWRHCSAQALSGFVACE